ncbi:hypothetical protein FCOIX_7131 [Fusarium coicis]|nr:hypothetical protein FCOIX_7131 [Fusarium coicis]
MATPDAPWTITHSPTDTIAPAWIDSPNIRGTLDILQSSILTLIACIYTALHLDVPVKTAWHYIFLYKLKWVAITLFAPEIALYMAADQLQQAWNLRSKLRSLQNTAPSDPDHVCIDPYHKSPGCFMCFFAICTNDLILSHIDVDMAYTFFIIMGGVRVNVDDILSFPDLHNKAFRLFESMERPYSQHPDQPPPPRRGSPMQPDWVTPKPFRMNIDDVSRAEEMQLFEEAPESSSRNWIGWSWMRRLARPPAYERLPDTWANPRSGPWVKPEPGLEMWPGDILPSGLLYHSEFAHIPLVLSEQFLHRWDAILSTFPFHNREALVKTASFVKVNRIAWDFEMISPADDVGPQAGQDLFLTRLPEFKPVLDPAYRTMPFSEGKRNLYINFSVFTESEGVFGLLGFFQQFPWLAGLALLLSGIYGGVHLSAWNWSFPNSIEHSMWKISCLYIAGALALYFVMAVLATAVRTDGTTWLVTYIAFWLALLVYMAARLYVVFESFLSLRRSPAGVYISPAWVKIFPHF